MIDLFITNTVKRNKGTSCVQLIQLFVDQGGITLRQPSITSQVIFKQRIIN
jgi:hypothetical protein